jgi:signal peptidase I
MTRISSFTLLISLLILSCGPRHIRMPSTAMEGTIKNGTELKIKKTHDIGHNSIIAFQHKDPLQGEQIMVLRVVAIPGDTIKIRSGQVFVNKVLFQEPEQIKFSYQVLVDGKLSEKLIEGMEYVQINSREYVFQLSRDESKKLWNYPSVATVRILARNPGYLQEGIFGGDAKDPWNVDKYGPIKVPLPGEAGATENLYFALGDNRHNAIDSRYFGYISEKDIIGVVEQ